MFLTRPLIATKKLLLKGILFFLILFFRVLPKMEVVLSLDKPKEIKEGYQEPYDEETRKSKHFLFIIFRITRNLRKEQRRKT